MTLILVDDVITTGATIEAVGRVLKSAGAKNVFTASAGLAKGLE
ncbi:MAG: phosphoribosyltransferase family protein [Bacteroidota bacterium]|nr:phosphoribosyltransferase family protein [Bacteroidota bacterium]